ncbi:ferredoxin [Actinomadura sediminis]|uniref:Ferredoxin n=1 Tax=Actinomadura sediminis TaxID=1038904 RepID=A0ABW3ELL5_9ACTN
MRVIVDYDICDSNGLCAEVAPEIFELDEEDRLRILDERPGPERWGTAEAAARACPKLAIALEAG